MKKSLILFSVCINSFLYGQDGVLIGNKPTAIDNSAELEIYSTSLGVLLPRVATTASIIAPATGLLVYDVSNNSYAYFDGAAWILLPIANFSEIHDTDNNTRVTVEKTADADRIQIERAAGISSIIDNTGMDMAASQPYYINGSKIGVANASSIFLGTNAGGSTPISTQNVMVGTNAGAGVAAGTGNVAMGFGTGATSDFTTSVLLGSQAGAVNAANDNVFAGSAAGQLNSTGTNNVFVGNLAGNDNTTGTGNVLIGHNAGDGLVSGTGNIVIGAGTTLNAAATDSLKIGKIIAAKDKISFNNAYSFPNTAGATNQTLVLDADLKSLKWVASGVSDADKTVLGSAAGLYSFDFGAKGSDVITMQRQMFLIPLVAASSAQITQLMTWKKIATDEDTQMALYDENFNLLSTTATVVIPGNPKVAFVSQLLTVPQTVTQGKTYYIGVRAHGAFTDYAGSPMTGTYYYMDTDGNPGNTTGISTNEAFPAKFDTGGTGFPAGYQRYTYTGNVPWVRAF